MNFRHCIMEEFCLGIVWALLEFGTHIFFPRQLIDTISKYQTWAIIFGSVSYVICPYIFQVYQLLCKRIKRRNISICTCAFWNYETFFYLIFGKYPNNAISNEG